MKRHCILDFESISLYKLCSFVLFVGFLHQYDFLSLFVNLKVTVDLDVCLHEKLLMYSYSISVADRMCRSGAVDLICIDSVSALTPRAEIEVSLSPPPHSSFSLVLFELMHQQCISDLFFRVR